MSTPERIWLLLGEGDEGSHAWCNTPNPTGSDEFTSVEYVRADTLVPTLGGGARRMWHHRKRGTTYEELGRAELQAAEDVVEGMTLVVYRGEDGKLWVRQEDEFEDGRFVPVPQEQPE